MKTIGLILTCTFLFNFGYSQKLKEKDVPASVVNAFKAKFPSLKAEEWEKEENYFEAEFNKDGKEYEAAFDTNGKWIETEREIKSSELPQVVKDAITKTSYKDWEVEEAVELESPEYKLAYEVEMEKGKQKISLYFTPEGKLIKEEKE
jgi:hypothetical protein